MTRYETELRERYAMKFLQWLIDTNTDEDRLAIQEERSGFGRGMSYGCSYENMIDKIFAAEKGDERSIRLSHRVTFYETGTRGNHYGSQCFTTKMAMSHEKPRLSSRGPVFKAAYN